MPRKSAECIVKEKYPTARAERHRTNGREVYYLIRIGKSFMPCADGKTRAAAWKQAAKRLEKSGKLTEG